MLRSSPRRGPNSKNRIEAGAGVRSCPCREAGGSLAKNRFIPPVPAGGCRQDQPKEFGEGGSLAKQVESLRARLGRSGLSGKAIHIEAAGGKPTAIRRARSTENCSDARRFRFGCSPDPQAPGSEQFLGFGGVSPSRAVIPLAVDPARRVRSTWRVRRGWGRRKSCRRDGHR